MLKKGLNTAKIESLSLASTSEKRLLEYLGSSISQSKKVFVTTPNPEFLVFAKENPWFRKVLGKADIALPDGIGLIWAGRFLGRPIKERLSGTDLMAKLCQVAAQKKWSVYLIGGQLGIAEKTLLVLKKRYPGLKGLAESGHELELVRGRWSKDSRKRIEEMIKKINSQKPDLLFVAFGMGKQEKFIADNWRQLKVKLAIGVGGAFDYLSGEIPRAPRWMRNLGLEWLFRLFRQPWRWKRQLRLIKFVWLIFKERLSKA